jgi:hypothetical protein
MPNIVTEIRGNQGVRVGRIRPHVGGVLWPVVGI